VLVAAADGLNHRDPVQWHRGALATVGAGVRGDDEQVTLGLQAGVDRDLQVAIEAAA